MGTSGPNSSHTHVHISFSSFSLSFKVGTISTTISNHIPSFLSVTRVSCIGSLKPVLETLVTLKKLGMWFEIVVLIVPTLYDSEKELKEMCTWVCEELGQDVQIHFSRFHPTYKITNLPPTPVRTLEMARRIAQEAGLNFAYVGNVPGHEGEHTYCRH